MQMKIHFITDVQSDITRDFLFSITGNEGETQVSIQRSSIEIITKEGKIKARKGEWLVEFDNGIITKVDDLVGRSLAHSIQLQKDARDKRGLDLITGTKYSNNEGHAYQAGVSNFADFVNTQNKEFKTGDRVS